ncbi:MAG: hypothetical protein JWR08_339 [Enterovirga sp.]|nr:hypothetical protein [Enterovirga sp.]
MPERLLHGRKDLGVLSGLDVDYPVGMEAHGGERRREEIAAPKAPEHRAPAAGQDPGHEQRRGGGMLALDAAFDEFVQRPERQAIPGQVPVERGDPERKGAPLRPRGTVERHDAATQIGQSEIVPGIGHALLEGVQRRCCSYFVLAPKPSQSVARVGSVSV